MDGWHKKTENDLNGFMNDFFAKAKDYNPDNWHTLAARFLPFVVRHYGWPRVEEYFKADPDKIMFVFNYLESRQWFNLGNVGDQLDAIQIGIQQMKEMYLKEGAKVLYRMVQTDGSVKVIEVMIVQVDPKSRTCRIQNCKGEEGDVFCLGR